MKRTLKSMAAVSLLMGLGINGCGISSGKKNANGKAGEGKKDDSKAGPGNSAALANLSCYEKSATIDGKNYNHCCIDLSQLASKPQDGLSRKDDHYEVDGNKCPVVSFDGTADIDMGLEVNGAKYLVGPEGKLDGLRGTFVVRGKDDQQPTRYVESRESAVSVFANDLVFENVEVLSKQGLQVSVNRHNQVFSLDNVVFQDNDQALSFKTDEGARSGEQIPAFYKQVENGFKPSFTNVTINGSNAPIATDYPYNFSGISFDKGASTYDPYVSLRGMYYAAKGQLTADLPYVISEDFSLEEGASLKAAAGAIIKLKSKAFNVLGSKLQVLGTAQKPVIFTSFRDDVGGDTNGDDQQTQAENHDWLGVRIDGDYYNSAIRSTVSFDHAEIRYSGIGIGDSDLSLSSTKITGSVAADSMFVHYASSWNGNGYGAGLFMYHNAVTKVVGPLKFDIDSPTQVKGALIIETNGEVNGAAKFLVQGSGDVKFHGSDMQHRVCVDANVDNVLPPFTVEKIEVELSGLADSDIVIKDGCLD